eukprot:74879_1
MASQDLKSNFIMDEILLNICSFFETFYGLDGNLFTNPPLSPKDWIDELQTNAMSINLNSIILELIQLCGIKSRKDIKTRLQYLPNDDLEELLFNECQQRQDQFILHCPKDEPFTNLFQTVTKMDIDHDANDTNNKQEMNDSEDEPMDDTDGIPWQRVGYHQLPLSYKLSILMNVCDWILVENKAFRKAMNSIKKALIMQPIFTDSTDIKYYLFGAQSMQSCLFREKEDAQSTALNVYGCDEYTFQDYDELTENHGLYFGNLECVAIGMEGTKEFAVQIDRMKQGTLYNFVMVRINEMEILEKKKMRESRRKKMRQQKMAKEFAFNEILATYKDDKGNRRSTRMKGKKKVSYKEHEEEDDEEDVKDEAETQRSEIEEVQDELEDNEPQFHPSGRPKRQCAKKRKFAYT